MTDERKLPTGEQLKEQGGNGEYPVFPSDDYIVKVAKVILEKKQKYQSSTPNDLELMYTLICLPYKFKNEDGLTYKGGKEAKPLAGWLFKQVNPFVVGAKKDGSPSNLRAFIAYSQGESADLDVAPTSPGVIVLDADDNTASPEATKKYKTQFKQFVDKKITQADFMKENYGFKHIHDLTKLEGKYVGAKIIIDEKGKNKLIEFSKLPSSFKADVQTEMEGMAKFNESYQKMQQKKFNTIVAEAKSDDQDLPF